jgi:CoA:oxalate CoA-transferase
MIDPSAMRAPHGPRIFDDIRVLDFTAIIAGSYCTRMLADLGADVLKVEPPGGELMRHLGPLRGEFGTVFASLNSGKRSLKLDLKQAAAADICKRLVAQYDVVVENFSPGVMARLGLDYASLRPHNEKLVMCSISGYGQSGPDAGLPAFAPIVQALSGYELVNQDSQPGLARPLNMGLPVGDTTAALQAFGAISAALYYRMRTGTGQYIDIAMMDSLLSTMHRDFQTAFNPDLNLRIYGPLATNDGYIIAMPLSQPQFEKLTHAIGRPEMRDDPRFVTSRARFEHYNELMALTEEWTRVRSADEALRGLAAADVPCARYRRIAELADDAQLKHRDMLVDIVDGAGPLKVPNSPFLFSETHAAVKPMVAALGTHNEAVLREELAMDSAQIEALRAAGVFG